MTNGHPTREEDFDLYVLGALEGDEKQAIESHLAACADCARKLAAARGRVAAISFAAPRVEDIVAALEAEAMALATRLANGPAHAYGRTKALIESSVGQMLDAQLQRETKSFAACAAGDEFVEGVRAFLEKRRPDFLRARQP